MGFSQLRRFDVQAKYALVLSLMSVAPWLGAMIVVARNYDHNLGQIVHGAKSLFLPVFLACLGSSLVLSLIGSGFGLNSAGQRRNDKPKWSWTGFLVGSGVATLNVILLIAYFMLKMKQPG